MYKKWLGWPLVGIRMTQIIQDFQFWGLLKPVFSIMSYCWPPSPPTLVVPKNLNNLLKTNTYFQTLPLGWPDFAFDQYNCQYVEKPSQECNDFTIINLVLVCLTFRLFNFSIFLVFVLSTFRLFVFLSFCLFVFWKDGEVLVWLLCFCPICHVSMMDRESVLSISGQSQFGPNFQSFCNGQHSDITQIEN